MTTHEFFQQFPDEASCILHFKELRESNGLCCRKCQSKRLSWISTRNYWQCMDCKASTTLRSGTIMMHSKLNFLTWYTCIYHMLTTKKAVSASDMQRRLGLKRYEPVWVMMHKIRAAMGHHVGFITLNNVVEVDDAFLGAVKKDPDPDADMFNRGRGSKKKVPVLLAIESVERIKPKKRKDLTENTRAGLLRIEYLFDQKGETMTSKIARWLHPDSRIKSDAYPGYSKFKDVVKQHDARVTPAKEAHKFLPWVHTAISNLRKNLDGIYHHVSDTHMQQYLDEYCFKFNHRFNLHSSFNQLFKTSSSYCLHRNG